MANDSILVEPSGEQHSLVGSVLGYRLWGPLGEMSRDPKLSTAIKGLDVTLRVLGSHGRFLSRED